MAQYGTTNTVPLRTLITMNFRFTGAASNLMSPECEAGYAFIRALRDHVAIQDSLEALLHPH